MADLLTLSLWQRIFLWPGMTFMDWLAVTRPELVIRHGFGFTVESYLLWSAVISSVTWSAVLLLVWYLLRRWLSR